MIGRAEPHFSFAGLKTAVRRRAQQAQALAPLSDRDIADLCAEFQAAVCESLADRVLRAMAIADVRLGSDRHLVVAGGVAANRQIHRALTEAAAARGWRLHVPPPQLCTDNGAMIAWAGAERLALGLTDGLDFEARARWPLDAQAIPALGGGRHGAKA
jgi:N6-L-threonylcarbamoyladenine synthase